MDERPESVDYVPVYEAPGMLAGESVRLMLEATGIPAMISQESAGVTFGLTIGSLGRAKIYVPADREEEARQILRDMEAGLLDEVPFTEEEDDTGEPGAE